MKQRSHETVNKQNKPYWSSENLHWVQVQQKVNVCIGMIGNRILDYYFFQRKLTSNIYLDFLLLVDLIPALAIMF